MPIRHPAPSAFLALVLVLGCAAGPAAARDESPHEAVCRLIEDAAASHDLPVRFFTRLIWRESSFRKGVTSRAGAQGIAQFMPGTASERGLTDPFDPEQAIPASADLLADLRDRFGNLGLAAAGYNAGPRRVERWQAGETGLPFETEAYVRFVTGHDADLWLTGDPGIGGPTVPVPRPRPGGPTRVVPADPPPPHVARVEAPPPAPRRGSGPPSAPPSADTAAAQPDERCLTVVAAIRTEMPAAEGVYDGMMAPWGVQLAGNYSKTRVLDSFERLQRRHAKVLAGLEPLVIGTRVGGRGPRRFYRVRIAMETRKEANTLCRRLRADGGSCLVQRN